MDNKIKACFLIFCLLASVTVNLLACSSASSEDLIYDESDSGKEVTVSLNDSFKITLNIASGYFWNVECTIDDESVVEQINHESKAVGIGAQGIGTQIWTFKAVGPGEAKITNEYSKLGSQNIKNFTLYVVVE